MVDIATNLLKNRPTLSEKDYQRERKLLQSSVMSLVLMVVVIVALSLWNFVIARKLGRIDASLTKAATEMQGFTQASAQQIYLKTRLNLVTGFLADRSLTRNALQRLFTTTIPGTHIGNLAFEGDTLLNVQYVCDDYKALDQLLKYYEAETGYFTQVVSKGINRSKDGSYQITLVLTIPKGEN